MTDYPVPIPGLVIRYSYLWKRAADRGEVEGQKHRPCAIVVAVEKDQGELVVTVAPLTRTKLKHSEHAIELTAATRRRLGLGGQVNWIMATEVNCFYWPGPDLRLAPNGNYAYGELPAAVFNALKAKILAADAAVRVVSRDE